MICPPFPGVQIRQFGLWACEGDSICAPNFGGVVCWAQQLPSLANTLPDSIVMQNIAIPGQTEGPSTMTSPIPAMISSGQVSICDALFDPSKNYCIYSNTSGLNDLAQGRSVTDTYADIAALRAHRTAVGFQKTIYICPVRLDGGYFSTAPAQAQRTALIAAATANSAGYDAVINVDSIPGTPGDGVNYATDHIHLTTAGQAYYLSLVQPVWRALVGL